MNNQHNKEQIRERYNKLALSPKISKGCGCKPMDPSEKQFTITSEGYESTKGYVDEADLGIGCGLPVQYAGIKKGDTVIDLGSGAGNDCFIAREEAGTEGRIIGIDFAQNMISRAKANARRRGFTNVNFVEGDIEQVPLQDETADVIISNCVLNLIPNKRKVFNEIYRLLRPNGHFCVSDIVVNGIFPKTFIDEASLYAGCIATAIQEDEYLGYIKEANFKGVRIVRRKRANIPQEVINTHLNKEQIEKLCNGEIGIYSITVIGEK